MSIAILSAPPINETARAQNDVTPPSALIEPPMGEGDSATVTVTIHVCDNRNIGTHTIYMDAVDVSSQFVPVAAPRPPGFCVGQYTMQSYRKTFTFSPGYRVLEAYIRDGAGNDEFYDWFYVYNPYRVVVTPADTTVSPTVGAPLLAQNFTVKNTGTVTTAFDLGFACLDGATQCSVPPSTTPPLVPGASTTVPVTFRAGGGGTNWGVVLTASHELPDLGWVSNAGWVRGYSPHTVRALPTNDEVGAEPAITDWGNANCYWQ